MTIKLKALANLLESMVNTEWAEEHSHMWDELADMMERAYDAGEITAEEFDDIALRSFYDFAGELKGEYED